MLHLYRFLQALGGPISSNWDRLSKELVPWAHANYWGCDREWGSGIVLGTLRFVSFYAPLLATYHLIGIDFLAILAPQGHPSHEDVTGN